MSAVKKVLDDMKEVSEHYADGLRTTRESIYRVLDLVESAEANPLVTNDPEYRMFIIPVSKNFNQGFMPRWEKISAIIQASHQRYQAAH